MVIAFWIMLIVGVLAIIPICTIMVRCSRRSIPLPPFVRKYGAPILVVGTILLSLALCAAVDIIT